MKCRTKQGLILEKLLHNFKWRWILCWKGVPTDQEWGGAYDCACCITYFSNEDLLGCGCPCHARIESMANSNEMLMFLLALDASGEIPFVPKNYEDWMIHNRKQFAEHEKWRKEGNPSAGGDCCEACKMVRDMDAKYEEHQKDPKNHCDSSPCHVCAEYRSAHNFDATLM